MVLANRREALAVHFHICKQQVTCKIPVQAHGPGCFYHSRTVGWSQTRSPEHWGSSSDASGHTSGPVFTLHGPSPALLWGGGSVTSRQKGSGCSQWGVKWEHTLLGRHWCPSLGAPGTAPGHPFPAKDTGVPPPPQLINYF